MVFDTHHTHTQKKNQHEVWPIESSSLAFCPEDKTISRGSGAKEDQ